MKALVEEDKYTVSAVIEVPGRVEDGDYAGAGVVGGRGADVVGYELRSG